MTRVPRRHGDRHGESKDTSPKISNKSRLYYCSRDNSLQQISGWYLGLPSAFFTLGPLLMYTNFGPR